MLFDIETSTKRRLFYSGALEAMHIAQSFTDHSLKTSMNKTGKLPMLKELRLVKYDFQTRFEFSEDIENSFQQIEDFEAMIDEANPGLHPSK